ncbi:NAD-dependent epimerase/dehydratase family protein [Thermopolyspora sp. NPDC052614]|uniref:NAD-dependent epimerase/dehydratase family protein n=1 Tax=Thermopolyspora sp. NPDC052614 TaxID=3155682 RepID=UPI00342E14FF
MKVLVIGGTVFQGRAIVAEALRRGHEVTTFNRGRSAPDVEGVEAVRGDRQATADLERLVNGREWDFVVDVCGFVPRVVAESARLLSGRAATYAFVSSISAVSGYPASVVDESSPLYECSPDAGPDDGPDGGDYGVLKAGCERAVEKYFDGNRLIVVPGLILGPHENVGRLPTWLRRVHRGGRFVAPGDPGRPLQLIDARDIAIFTLDQAERGVDDRFLLTGPPGGTTFGDLLADCAAVTGSTAEPVWMDDQFLLDHGVQPWLELPLWAPEQPDWTFVWQISTAKAQAAGLRCRPITETVRDTWAWLRDLGVPDKLIRYRDTVPEPGIDPGKESRILAAWDARAREGGR